MKPNRNVQGKRSVFFTFVAVLMLLQMGGVVSAGDITPKMQLRIDAYKKQAAVWAADPLIVKAVMEGNAKGPIPMMGNAKWRELKESDPIVKAFVDNPAGSLMTKWLNADSKGINKIVLTGNKSQRIAFTSMPAIYLGKGKPNFDTSFDEDKVWQQGETKPDPSTNIDSVQISAPVKGGGEVIGVLLVALTASYLQ